MGAGVRGRDRREHRRTTGALRVSRVERVSPLRSIVLDLDDEDARSTRAGDAVSSYEDRLRLLSWGTRWTGQHPFTHCPPDPPGAENAEKIWVGWRGWSVSFDPLRLGALHWLSSPLWEPGEPMRAVGRGKEAALYAHSARGNVFGWAAMFPDDHKQLVVYGRVALWDNIRSGGGGMCADSAYPLSFDGTFGKSVPETLLSDLREIYGTSIYGTSPDEDESAGFRQVDSRCYRDTVVQPCHALESSARGAVSRSPPAASTATSGMPRASHLGASNARLCTRSNVASSARHSGNSSPVVLSLQRTDNVG